MSEKEEAVFVRQTRYGLKTKYAVDFNPQDRRDAWAVYKVDSIRVLLIRTRRGNWRVDGTRFLVFNNDGVQVSPTMRRSSLKVIAKFNRTQMIDMEYGNGLHDR